VVLAVSRVAAGHVLTSHAWQGLKPVPRYRKRHPGNAKAPGTVFRPPQGPSTERGCVREPSLNSDTLMKPHVACVWVSERVQSCPSSSRCVHRLEKTSSLWTEHRLSHSGECFDAMERVG
jgi:hypothetical protein